MQSCNRFGSHFLLTRFYPTSLYKAFTQASFIFSEELKSQKKGYRVKKK
ncbi:hypothetical protein QQP08_023536 [Theobroma cacao]|nr:hypothetical protein QQP08_023536 [Theobroma cacao]